VSFAKKLRTARRIPPGQLAHRMRFVALRRVYGASPTLPFSRAARAAAGTGPAGVLPRVPDDVLWPEGLDAVQARAKQLASGRFVYLNRAADYIGGVRWKDESASKLWLYQLHYLSAVSDLVRAGRADDARRVLASWRSAFENRWDDVAWHPYPTSLRLANLCVAATTVGGFDKLGDGVASLVAVHAAFLLSHLEHDVRGNHLFENARALLWASRCLRGGVADECGKTARAVLAAEIPEQVLADGGHFELSPMYHCIVMRGLCEIRALLGDGDPLVKEHVAPALRRMGEFLAGILCPDDDIPLLGDSARGFGPPPMKLLALVGAKRKKTSGVRAFPDTGLHVLANERIWAILDAGPVCPPYLPAHGQADSLTVEVWIDGTRVVCDPGVFGYDGAPRKWSKTTRSHSAPSIDDRDSSEVYDSFRVGGRAEIQSVGVADAGDEVVARMRPFGTEARITRSVRLFGNSLTIEDVGEDSTGEATLVSRLHLAPGPKFVLAGDAAKGAVTGANSRFADVAFTGVAKAEKGRTSREFGISEDSIILRQSAPAAGGRLRWVIGPP